MNLVSRLNRGLLADYDHKALELLNCAGKPSLDAFSVYLKVVL
jgi:hypothetical protein